MEYQLAFDNQGKMLTSLRRNRLVKRACNFLWIGAVHEYLAVGGNIEHCDVTIQHLPIEHDIIPNFFLNGILLVKIIICFIYTHFFWEKRLHSNE
jgi:hypothetical protein